MNQPLVARVEWTHGSSGRERLVELAKDPQKLSFLRSLMYGVPDNEEHLALSYMWPGEAVIELSTDGRWLSDNGVTFEVKNFKGTLPLNAILPDQDSQYKNVTVHVQIPHVGLLMMDEVEVRTDYCTEQLQRDLNDGWRILCVCPPNAARRPDYILGRTKEKR